MIPVTCIEAAYEALKARKDEINKLNVFPVPDGDTGTNMTLTLESVMKEISALPLPQRNDMSAVRKAVTHGSLMGARGNSGVITSQILRGICEGMEGATAFDTHAIAVAMAKGVEVSFKAVRKPVEGTILTVMKDSAEAAHQADADGMERNDALLFISQAAFESVKRTPELLPVLKENNVVDAGGFGLSILIEGFTASVTGATTSVPDSSVLTQTAPKVAIEQINDWAGSKFMYCTEFLFHGVGLDKETTHDFLASMGDCELIVGEEPDYKVHVHTDTPGTVLSYMTDRGQVSEVYIHNMKLQADERTAGLERDEENAEKSAPAKAVGYVAVAAGSGMKTILESLGVDYVVSGGQTMNPSTADLLAAIEAVNAESVIVMPDNRNIIMAAQAACTASEKKAAVVPTTNVPAAFSAMFAADQDATLEENVSAMSAVLDDISYGEVTTAIKDAKAADGTPIHDGDVIGISDDSIDIVGSDVADVTLDLLGSMCDKGDVDTLMILAGCDFSDDEFDALISKIEERFPDLEVDSHRGEQPLYPIVMSLE